MDQDKRLHRTIPLAMRLSMRSACPYIDGQTEQRIAVDIQFNPDNHDTLARAGFRRVENWVYRPACPNCNACTPWRVDVAGFAPSRNMARIKKANQDLRRTVTGLSPTAAHYKLFKAYVTSRHDIGQMAQMDRDDFISMITNSPIETVLINYHDRDDNLVAVALVDIQSDGLSAVYSFFTPDAPQRSLGTFIILDLLTMAQETDLPWVYLGYYVQKSRKMVYKSRFHPAQIYKDGEWIAYSPPRLGTTKKEAVK